MKTYDIKSQSKKYMHIHGHQLSSGPLTREKRYRNYYCYYIAAEGFSEINYFCLIDSKRDDLKIRNELDIVKLIRFDQESMKSEPLWIAKAMDDYRHCIETGEYSVHLFVGDIIQQLYSEITKNDRKLINDFIKNDEAEKKRIKNEFKERWKTIAKKLLKHQYTLISHLKNSTYVDKKYVSNENEATELCRDLLKTDYPEYVDYLKKPKYRKKETFDEKFDIFCLLFDRDRLCNDRNDEVKYTSILSNCNSLKISTYVSNPSFEFWIIMHHNDLLKIIDENKLLKNDKEERNGEKRNYAEWLLDDYYETGYEKTMDLSPHITTCKCTPILEAIENSKSYAQNNNDLENKIGSTVNLLIERIQNNN